MEANLASNADARLILKLYELRMEATMRAARQWFTAEFWPASADDVFAVVNAFGQPHNQYFRQVLSYWEMAASFALAGAMNGELFLDCNRENLFIYAKLLPLLPAIREKIPALLEKTEELLKKYPSAKQRVEEMTKNIAALRARAEQAGE